MDSRAASKQSVAIIPARVGSKRIPKKNIKPFLGKPMIQYSIEAALETGLFREVVVSTDSPEIAEIAERLGAKVPMLRPAELSDDFTPMGNVLAHAVREMVPDYQNTPYVCFLLATAPFVQASFIRQGHEMIHQHDVGSVYPVTSFPFPIFRAFKQAKDGHLEWCWPEHAMTRSNDLPETYHDAGQFYWVKTSAFLKTEIILQKDSIPLKLPRHLVQDIDTPEDWDRAEKLYRAFFLSNANRD